MSEPEHIGGIIERLFAELGIPPSNLRPAQRLPTQGTFAFSMANGPTYGYAETDSTEPTPFVPMQAVAECPVCHWIDQANPRPDRCPNCGESKPLE